MTSRLNDERTNELIDEVCAVVGNDGTGDIGIIVRQALHDDPEATTQDIIDIVASAREDAEAERAAYVSIERA